MEVFINFISIHSPPCLPLPLSLTHTQNTDWSSFILGLWPLLLDHPPPTPHYTGIDVERAKRKSEAQGENKTQPHLSAPVLLRNLTSDKSRTF